MKTRIAFAFKITLLLSSVTSASESLKLKTPRGAEIEVRVHDAALGARPLIVVAPGQSCNSKGPLFETLGEQGALQDFHVVRFEWAYCGIDPKKPLPSEDLRNEIEDFETALAFGKGLPGVDPSRILISGKSMGSLVAASVFKKHPEAIALSLLTPICSYTTDEKGNPLEQPERVGEQSYPGLKAEKRPVLMSLGDQDDLCLLPVLFDFLKDTTGNIRVQVAGGDHGFRVKGRNGAPSPEKTERNLRVLVQSLLIWADLQLNP